MTVLEIERLVRRIEEAMERTPSPALPRLAGEFQAVSSAAALRLSQCSAMLAAGDEHQALQLAETQPPLLDVLTLLSFRRSPEWLRLCEAGNLPAPGRFDLKPIRQLNELYARGIDKDHALYREYRRAVMLNDDARAVAFLRSITRLNPNDTNARLELERLERKQRAGRIQKLEQMIRGGASPAEVAALVDQVEPLPEASQSSCWPKAQAIRASHLLASAREARRSAPDSDLPRLLQKLATLTPFLDESERADLAELDGWSAADTARRKEVAGRKAAIEQLSALVRDEPIGPRRSVAELQDAATQLERAWRQIEHSRVELPADLSRRVEKQRQALQLAIDRSMRASRLVAFAAVAAVVIFCIGGAWYAYTRQAARVLAARLHTLVAERKVSEAEAALENSASQFATPDLTRARQDAAEFISREHEAKAAVAQAVASLDQAALRNFTNAPLEKIAADFDAAAAGAAALPPEFRAPAESALNKSRTAWQTRLEHERGLRTQRLAQIVEAAAAAVGSEVSYEKPPDRVAAATQRVLRELDSARALSAPATPELRPAQEALFKFQSLEASLEKFGREAADFLAARDLLATTNLNTYAGALQLLASSGFTPASQRATLASLAALNISARTLIPPLLDLHLKPDLNLRLVSPRRIPEEVLPAEREIQRKLRDDENINSVQRLEIEVKSLPPEDPRRRRVVFVRGELQRRLTRRSGQIYDPVESPASLQFASKELGSLEYNVEEPSPTPEKELYERAGLSRLLDSNTGLYQTSLLQSLDEINRDRKASPLFRAWLFLRVCEMTDAQPVQWGASFSPALASDRAELQRLGAGQIRPGDWFVPARNAQRSAALNAHFDRAADRAYARQSAFFKKILPKAIDAGVILAGHVNADGEPMLNSNSTRGRPIWVFAAPNTAPVRFQASPGFRAMPYSPMFTMACDFPVLADETLQELGYSAAATGLPDPFLSQ